jgi:F-box and leucine-rich repeat protein 4
MYSEDNSDESLSDEFEQEKDYDISQWVDSVIDFSCSYGNSISYSAVNICGRPSKYPAYGDFAECFSMRRYGPTSEAEREISSKDQQDIITFHDFIVIKYEHYVLPKAIKIYETYNPGSIVKIYAYCCTTKEWKILWQAQPAPVEKKAREFRPQINKIILPTR